MRTLAEYLLRIWPINWLAFALWRYLPFPRGLRSRVIRTANDHFLVGVMAMIYDDEGRLLLVRNTYDPRFEWSLPGGWMGRNEQPAECIKRELREETGFEVRVECLLDARTRSRMPSLDLIFRCSLTSDEFRGSAEVVDARFFALDDLPEGLTPGHRRLAMSLSGQPAGS